MGKVRILWVLILLHRDIKFRNWFERVKSYISRCAIEDTSILTSIGRRKLLLRFSTDLAAKGKHALVNEKFP